MSCKVKLGNVRLWNATLPSPRAIDRSSPETSLQRELFSVFSFLSFFFFLLKTGPAMAEEWDPVWRLWHTLEPSSTIEFDHEWLEDISQFRDLLESFRDNLRFQSLLLKTIFFFIWSVWYVCWEEAVIVHILAPHLDKICWPKHAHTLTDTHINKYTAAIAQTTWENLQIEKHKPGRRSFRSPDWFVLFDLQIFSGGAYTPSATSHTISFFYIQ